jgi:DNA-binding transcriptional MerR regulator
MYYTIGKLAKHFGVPPWRVRRAIERGFLPEPPRVGAYRVFLAQDLPDIEAALRLAGYLTESAEAVDANLD